MGSLDTYKPGLALIFMAALSLRLCGDPDAQNQGPDETVPDDLTIVEVKKADTGGDEAGPAVAPDTLDMI